MSKNIDEKQYNTLSESLKELGLTTKEASVYLTLLELGETGTSPIIRQTKLHRQFVYDALTSLEDKGLVGHSVVRGRKKFFSYDVSKLSGMFDHKKRIADDLVKHLEKTIMPVDIQEIEMYKGQEAFVANEFEILKKAAVGSKMYVFGGGGDEYEHTLGKYLTEYEYQRIKKNIEVVYIGSSSQREFLSKAKDARRLFDYRLLPSAFTGNLNITVYEDSICFYIWGSPVTNFTVRSKSIAKSYADFFMGLWKMSK